MMKIGSFLFALLTISTAYARADVSLRNGNFYVAFKDLAYPGGLEPKIERVYNSKSDYTGMFGFSWGSEYETQLAQDPDGSLLVTEFGGGAPNRFVAKNYSVNELEAGVNQLVEARKKAGMIASVKDAESYRNRVRNDFDYRASEYAIFVTKGFLAKKSVPEGTQLTSTSNHYQYITRVKGGYVRVIEGGLVQKFNEAGKLAQIIDRNKNFINFFYDRNNHLIQLVDNQNRKMNLTYNSQNLVDKIIGESGKHVEFKYTKEGLLAYSRDDSGVENAFKYTTDKFRNLTEILFLNDKDAKGAVKKMTVLYYGEDKFTSVKAVVNPDGTSNEYEYFKDPKNPNYYAVKVLLKESNGARISDSKYEYYYKNKVGGEEFTSKMISTIDGEKTETNYDDKLGYPVKIVAGSRTTLLEYDAKGRMTKKITPLETTTLTYDPGVGKVSKVTRKIKSGTILWSEFQYDKTSGNLVFAKNNDKKSVKLVYDTQGRIRALVDQSTRQLSFKYNELSKPIEISDAKLGTVKFTYKNSGEVDKIDSNGGSNVATEVMRALQGLIDITAPAGVTMSM